MFYICNHGNSKQRGRAILGERIAYLLLGADLKGGGAGMATATPNGRLAAPMATPFRFLDLIFFYLNFEML